MADEWKVVVFVLNAKALWLIDYLISLEECSTADWFYAVCGIACSVLEGFIRGNIGFIEALVLEGRRFIRSTYVGLFYRDLLFFISL